MMALRTSYSSSDVSESAAAAGAARPISSTTPIMGARHTGATLLQRLDRFCIGRLGEVGEIDIDVGNFGIGNLYRRVGRHLITRRAQLCQQRWESKRRCVEARTVAQRPLPDNAVAAI